MAEKEYIEREKALSAQNKSMNLSECRKRLERIPAADVRPVVRGRWENNGSDVWKCSACGYGIMPWNAGVNFCPNCGAEMEES